MAGVHGRACGDVPANVSLAVIAVPAERFAEVIEDCIESRVRGAVIVTSVEGSDIDVDELSSRRLGVPACA